MSDPRDKPNAHEVLMKRNKPNGTTPTMTDDSTASTSTLLKGKSRSERIVVYKKIETAITNGSHEYRGSSRELKGCFIQLLRDLNESNGMASGGQASNEEEQLREKLKESNDKIAQLKSRLEKLEQEKEELRKQLNQKKEHVREPASRKTNHQAS